MYAVLDGFLSLDWDQTVSIAHAIPIRTKSNKRVVRHVLAALILSHWAPQNWLTVEVSQLMYQVDCRSDKNLCRP